VLRASRAWHRSPHWRRRWLPEWNQGQSRGGCAARPLDWLGPAVLTLRRFDYRCRVDFLIVLELSRAHRADMVGVIHPIELLRSHEVVHGQPPSTVSLPTPLDVGVEPHARLMLHRYIRHGGRLYCAAPQPSARTPHVDTVCGAVRITSFRERVQSHPAHGSSGHGHSGCADEPASGSVAPEFAGLTAAPPTAITAQSTGAKVDDPGVIAVSDDVTAFSQGAASGER
jgi:hypothetical protein